MAHDVFISHSAKDHAIANKVCAELENEGIQCWIAPRDIMPGTEWGEAIIDAIGDSRLMVFVFSSNANTSKPTIREVERAEHRDILVIPFRIENVAPSKSLEYFISTSHWLDAFTPPLEQHLQRLAEIVKRQLVRLDKSKPVQAPSSTLEAKPKLQAALADRYTIERELGRGGTATVYLARDLRNRRAVAVKALNPELAHALGPARFLREIEIAANLNHPRILPLFDSGEAEGVLYYVMPYVEGESLQQRLKRERQLPEEDALRIAVEVASALSYAHRRGVVHRDIKPGNILLSGGEAVVADFGIARAISAAVGEDLTETGLVIGTPVYMSPEQASGEREIDGRSDIYSLGCVLYEMLAGEPPFSGPSAQAILAKSLSPPPSLRGIRPTISVAVEQAVTKALAQVPSDRFSTAEEFANALTRAAQTTVEATSISISPPPASVEAGDSFTLSALVRSAAGVSLPEREVRWTSSDPAIATVEVSRGLVNAVAPGSVTVTASGEGTQSSVALTVMAPRVAAVHVSVPPGTLRVGDRVQLTATLQDKRGAPLSRPVSWTSSDVSVARVSSAGVVTAEAQGSAAVSRDGTIDARNAGEAAITATADGVDGTVRLTVSPAVALAGRFKAAVAPLAPALAKLRKWWWTMPAAAAVVLLWTFAPFQQDGPGQDDQGDQGDTVPIAGVPPTRAGISTVAAVALSDPPSPIEVGDTFTLSATVRDGVGALLDGHPVRWHSSAPTVAAVSESTGTVTARAAGSAVIVAESKAKRDSVPLEVLKVAVASVTITTRPQHPILARRSLRLEAVVRDAHNRPIEGQKVTWVSSNPRVARADSLTGQVTALAQGLATIAAMSEGRRDSVRIAVTAEAPQLPPPDTGKPPGGDDKIDRAAAQSEIRAVIERQRRATELQDLDLAMREVSPAVGEELKRGFRDLREVKDITSDVRQVNIQIDDTAHARASFHDVITVTRKSTGERLVLFNGNVEYRLTRTGERWIITTSSASRSP